MAVESIEPDVADPATAAPANPGVITGLTGSGTVDHGAPSAAIARPTITIVVGAIQAAVGPAIRWHGRLSSSSCTGVILLGSPTALAFRKGNARVPVASSLITAAMPQPLICDPQFNTHYELTHKLDTDIYGSDGMLIFSRR